MSDKVRVCLGAIVLAAFLSIVFLATQLTFEWLQSKPADGAARMIWHLMGGFALLIWTSILWIGFTLLGGRNRIEAN